MSKIINFREVYGYIDIYGQGFKTYYGSPSFETVENPDEWLECPNCGLKPIVWEFDNGRLTACGCGEDTYKYFSVEAENIGQIMRVHHGNLNYYDSDKLRKNWNSYCKTGKVPELNYDEMITNTVLFVRSVGIHGGGLDDIEFGYSYRSIFQSDKSCDEINMEDYSDKSIAMPANIKELEYDKDNLQKRFGIIDMLEFEMMGKKYYRLNKIYEDADSSFIKYLEKSYSDEELIEIFKEIIS